MKRKTSQSDNTCQNPLLTDEPKKKNPKLVKCVICYEKSQSKDTDQRCEDCTAKICLECYCAGPYKTDQVQCVDCLVESGTGTTQEQEDWISQNYITQIKKQVTDLHLNQYLIQSEKDNLFKAITIQSEWNEYGSDYLGNPQYWNIIQVWEKDPLWYQQKHLWIRKSNFLTQGMDFEEAVLEEFSYNKYWEDAELESVLKEEDRCYYEGWPNKRKFQGQPICLIKKKCNQTQQVYHDHYVNEPYIRYGIFIEADLTRFHIEDARWFTNCCLLKTGLAIVKETLNNILPPDTGKIVFKIIILLEIQVFQQVDITTQEKERLLTWIDQ
jgi:hypothetical protein